MCKKSDNRQCEKSCTPTQRQERAQVAGTSQKVSKMLRLVPPAKPVEVSQSGSERTLPAVECEPLLLGVALFPNTASKSTVMAAAVCCRGWLSIPEGCSYIRPVKSQCGCLNCTSTLLELSYLRQLHEKGEKSKYIHQIAIV